MTSYGFSAAKAGDVCAGRAIESVRQLAAKRRDYRRPDGRWNVPDDLKRSCRRNDRQVGDKLSIKDDVCVSGSSSKIPLPESGGVLNCAEEARPRCSMIRLFTVERDAARPGQRRFAKFIGRFAPSAVPGFSRSHIFVRKLLKRSMCGRLIPFLGGTPARCDPLATFWPPSRFKSFTARGAK